MNLLEAIILGIVQGLTEFLPVSSSGHLELGKALLGINEGGLLFSIVVHGATALSTVVVFWKDIVKIFKGLMQFKWNEELRFTMVIVLSMIPVGIAGLLFEEQIEQFFVGNIFFVGLMLLVTGGLLLLTERVKVNDGAKVSFRNALIIGVAQAVAIFPGISRSGATISTALLLKVDRAYAARFSFLMVIPPILGANILKVKDVVSGEAAVENVSNLVLFAGFLSAFIVGILACKWMIKIVRNSKLRWFAFYCFAVGAAAIINSLYL